MTHCGGGGGVRDATSRRRVAAALVRACDVAGLYSYLGGDDAAPAPDRLNVRDRLGEYANALFAKTSDVSPGSSLGDLVQGCDVRGGDGAAGG